MRCITALGTHNPLVAGSSSRPPHSNAPAKSGYPTHPGHDGGPGRHLANEPIYAAAVGLVVMRRQRRASPPRPRCWR